MKSKKCANCGLVNAAQETVCRRCGQAFTVTPFVDAVIAGPQPWELAGPPAYPYGGPPPYAAGAAFDRDQEHLRLLSIFHYILAGLLALFGCVPIIHLVMGVVFIAVGSDMPSHRGDPPPAVVGWIFVGIASALILSAWSVAACVMFAGRFLARRTRHTFCLAVAAVSCLFFPMGTVLGAFTLAVLLRPSVKARFGPSRGSFM
jgi:hypothetical protein